MATYPKTKNPSPSNREGWGRKRWGIVVGSLLALGCLFGAIWGTWRFISNREIAQAIALQKELMDESLTDANLRKGKIDDLVKAIDGLNEGQRQQLREQMFGLMRVRMQDKMKSYLALPEDKKLGFITTEMFRMQARSSEFRQLGEKLGMGPGGQGGPPGMGGPPPGGWQNMSKEDRDAMRRKMLDRTTPEERAVWTAFMEDMRKNQDKFKLPNFRPGPQAQ